MVQLSSEVQRAKVRGIVRLTLEVDAMQLCSL